MREQLTPEGITVLITGLGLFWAVVLVLVRRHAQKNRSPAEPQA